MTMLMTTAATTTTTMAVVVVAVGLTLQSPSRAMHRAKTP